MQAALREPRREEAAKPAVIGARTCLLDRVLSLNTIIGALVAVSVALVALTALSITVSFGLDALRAIGKEHLAMQAASIREKSSNYFNDAANLLVDFQSIATRQPWGHPSDDPNALAVLESAHFASISRARRYLNSISVFAVFFKDNTQFMMINHPTYWFYTRTIAVASSFSATFPNSTLTVNVTRLNTSTNEIVNDPRVIAQVPPFAAFRASDGFWGSTVAQTARLSPLIATYAAVDTFNRTQVYVQFSVAIYPKGAAADFGNVYALCFVGLGLQSIGTFLRGAVPHREWTAVAFDGAGFVVASSENVTQFLRDSDAARSAAGLERCAVATTLPNEQISSTTRIVCRLHLSVYPQPIIRAIHAQRWASTQGDASIGFVDIISADGENYFAAAEPIRVRFAAGSGSTVAQFGIMIAIAEHSIIGDVVAGRVIAIGATFALAVLVSVLNLLLVSYLMSPLRRIADRMVSAADLEDDDPDRTLSKLTEVRGLQAAYYALNDELVGIRAFVPQTVLTARRIERRGGERSVPESDDISSLQHGALSDGLRTPSIIVVPTPRSNFGGDESSVGTRASLPNSDCLNNKYGPYAAMSLAPTMLRRVPVSVVAANLVAFHEALGARQSEDVLSGISAVVAAVHDAVAPRDGVFTFHGDHFLATFNASQPCPKHALFACEVALALAEVVPQIAPLHRGLRCGVATGHCVAGVVGSAVVRSFSTMGAAVSQAVRLDAIGRRFGCAVLVTERTLESCNGRYDFRFVDAPVMPSGPFGRGHAVLVAEISRRPGAVKPLTQNTIDTGDDDWFHGGGDAAPNAALQREAKQIRAQRNKAFELLAAGRRERAAKLVFDMANAFTAPDSAVLLGPPDNGLVRFQTIPLAPMATPRFDDNLAELLHDELLHLRDVGGVSSVRSPTVSFEVKADVDACPP